MCGHLWSVGGDSVEDVDEDEEEGDEERHAAGDDVRGDEEGDPGDHDEEAGGEVVGDDVGGEVALQSLNRGHSEFYDGSSYCGQTPETRG